VSETSATVERVRFGAFVREVSVNQQAISYNELTPKPRYDAQGRALPCQPEAVRVRAIDVQRLLAPYLGVRIGDQLRAVAPLALYLVLFQLLILRQTIADFPTVGAGLAAVILGLMLFMEGLKVGLMPFGEIIGDSLPKKSSLRVVLLITFLLGVGVTFAEPAIGALKAGDAICGPRSQWMCSRPVSGSEPRLRSTS